MTVTADPEARPRLLRGRPACARPPPGPPRARSRSRDFDVTRYAAPARATSGGPSTRRPAATRTPTSTCSSAARASPIVERHEHEPGRVSHERRSRTATARTGSLRLPQSAGDRRERATSARTAHWSRSGSPAPREIELLRLRRDRRLHRRRQLFVPTGTTGDGRSSATRLRLHSSAERLAFLKDFTLKLPPGFLGNPTPVLRPVRRTCGWPARAPTTPSSATRSPTRFPRNGFFLVPHQRVQPADAGLGAGPPRDRGGPGHPARAAAEHGHAADGPDFSELDEPNQQGADRYEGDQGDYGITATRSTSPRSWAATSARCARSTSCCARTPRARQDVLSKFTPQTVKPAPGAKPFFVNPTSCGTKNGAARGAVVLASGRDAAGHGHRAPTGGDFKLSVRRQTTTAALPYNASAADVQAALEALPSIGTDPTTARKRVGRHRRRGIYRVRFRDRSRPRTCRAGAHRCRRADAGG